MILILGKLRCDVCDVEADIRLELKEGSQGITQFDIEKFPEGWEYDVKYVGYGIKTYTAHACPTHAPSKVNR